MPISPHRRIAQIARRNIPLYMEFSGKKSPEISNNIRKILADFWLKLQRGIILLLFPNGGRKFLPEEVCSQFPAFRNIFEGKSAL